MTREKQSYILPHDREECDKIYVSWSKFTGIVLSILGTGLLISFAFGSTTVNMQRDIKDNSKAIVTQDERIKILEKQKLELRSISDKLDTLLQRK